MLHLRSVAVVTLTLAALAVVALPTACSAKDVCTPGQSVACTGPGGCAGGQVCAADGTGYGACACGASDSGVPNDGAAGDSAPGDGGEAGAPKHGAMHITWSLKSGSNPSTCAAMGGVTVDVVLTSSADGGVSEKKFPCADGSGDVTGLDFDGYAVSVSLLDGSSLAAGTAPVQNVTLGATGCDAIIAGDCAKNVPVVISAL